MSELAIRVEGLSKQYRLGSRVERYRTLRETVAEFGRKVATRLSRNGARKPEPPMFWALKDVSLEVRPGEVVGVIGRNGAGKTTLLKILSRVTDPTEGVAEIRGRVASLLAVGTGFHPELTGRENIFLSGAVLGMSRRDIVRRFDEIVAFAEVDKFVDTPVKHYSSGMYVRLAFAVAAHLEADVILVDEVLAVGDRRFQKRCLAKMGDVAHQGRTVLFVSHNMGAIFDLCPRTIWLDEGRIVEDGVTGQVISHYITFGEEVAGDIDLSPPSLRPNWAPESHFKWTRVTILNAEGKPTPHITLGEPFEILLGGVAEAPIEDVVFSLAIWAGGGGAGYLLDSMQIDSDLPTSYPAGPMALRIRFDPNLFAPGLLSLDINAHGRQVRDRIPGVARIYVEHSSDATRQTAGMIFYPCQWSLGRGDG